MKKISEHAEAAKQIRKILKNAFPEIKFSVSSSSFTGGTSIRVEYENGPISDKVRKLISHYQYGNFDSMHDIYEYSNTNKNIPQVKYLHVNREITNNMYDQIFSFAKSYFCDLTGSNSIDEWKAELRGTPRQYLFRYTSNMDLSNGFCPDLLREAL